LKEEKKLQISQLPPMKFTTKKTVTRLKKQNGTTALTICTINLSARAPYKKGYPLKPITYGDYLKQARLDIGYTQFELSLELGVYTSTIDKWERGICEPKGKNKKILYNFWAMTQ